MYHNCINCCFQHKLGSWAMKLGPKVLQIVPVTLVTWEWKGVHQPFQWSSVHGVSFLRMHVVGLFSLFALFCCYPLFWLWWAIGDYSLFFYFLFFVFFIIGVSCKWIMDKDKWRLNYRHTRKHFCPCMYMHFNLPKFNPLE